MRFNLRLLAAIWLPLVVVLGAFAYVSVERERARPSAELERRSWLLGEGSRRPWSPSSTSGSRGQIQRIVERFGSSARGVAVYDRCRDDDRRDIPVGRPADTRLPGRQCRSRSSTSRPSRDSRPSTIARPTTTRCRSSATTAPAAYWSSSPTRATSTARGGSSAQRHLIRFAVLIAVLSLVTMLVVRRSVTHPLNRMAEWASSAPGRPGPARRRLVRSRAASVPGLRGAGPRSKPGSRARVAIAEEARLRLRGEAVWTEERLTQFARARLGERPLVVVSNREPVSHVRRGRTIVTADARRAAWSPRWSPSCGRAAASGVAHASGDADREVVDERGMVRLAAGRAPLRAEAASGSPEEEDGWLLLRLRQRRACGRSATSSTPGRSSGPRTGASTRPSTRSSPTRCSR